MTRSGPRPPGEGRRRFRSHRGDGEPRRDTRWPPLLAILFLIVIPFLLPERLTLGPSWVLPAIGALILTASILADPGRIGGRRSSMARGLSIALTVAFIIGAALATFRLSSDILHGGPETNSASALLSAGSLVWIENNIIFGLLYWEMDGGGPARRADHPKAYRDFAYPQDMNPDIAPAGWRPIYVDYFYLGLTNALAFSPTDVMPLAPWAKLTMSLQSLLSVVVLTLVIARAVNILA